MKERYFLALAKKESLKSNNEQHQLGCVIARGNKILGAGYNVHKTHPKSPHEFKTIHAEFMAVLNSGFDVKGATVYVYREYANGSMAMSRPCPACWKFLMESGVKKVVYSCEGTFKTESLRR